MTQPVPDDNIVSQQQLKSLGIELPDDQLQALLRHVNERISTLISEEIVDSLDGQQIEQFVAMQQNNASPQEMEQWLQQQVPEYSQIIEDNVAIVLGEVVEDIDNLAPNDPEDSK